jgi:glutamate-1-semialdehyde aminotransferase
MNEQKNDNEFSLLDLVPLVQRARDFRLYCNGDRRLVDLWQNGGAAILGHTPPAVLREIKNTASRGLYAPFPHFTENRYIKALAKIFPGRKFRLYAKTKQFFGGLILEKLYQKLLYHLLTFLISVNSVNSVPL